MIFCVGCTYGGDLGQLVVQVEPAALRERVDGPDPPLAVLFAPQLWPAVRAVRGRVPVVAMVERAADVAGLTEVDDVVVATDEPPIVIARLERAMRRFAMLPDSVMQNALLRAASLACVVVDPAGVLHHSSVQFKAMWQLGRPIRTMAELPTACREALLAAHDGSDETFELSDGRYLRCRGTDVRDGELSVGTLATFEDVTENRKTETQLRHSDTMSSLGSFVAGIAHDVRNRLFGLSATVEAFHALTSTNPELVPFIEVLDEELRKLQRELGQVLDYGRASVVQLALDRIGDAVSDAVEMSADIARGVNTHVEVEVAPDLPIAALDKRRLAQAFHNLLVNAIQHAPNGRVGIAVTFERRGGRDAFVCRVVDTGPGFPAADLHRLFEPYFTRRSGGVGLGLTIVQRIAIAHGGTVEASNPPGGGGEITMVLPLVTRTARSTSS